MDCGVVEVNSEKISGYEEMNEKGGTSCIVLLLVARIFFLQVNECNKGW